MSTIVTRYGKGSPLTWLEVDNNFTNLNTDKYESGDSPSFAGLTISTATAGSVLFAGASGVVSQDNTQLFWDDTNNRLGIGTSSPVVKLDILSTVAAPVRQTLYGVAPAYTSRRANGTSESPTNITSGQTILQLNGSGYAATGWGNSQAVYVWGSASENWTDSSQASHLTFGTTATSSATPSERMRIDSSGNVGIGTSSPSSFGKLAILTTSGSNMLQMLTSGNTSGLYINSVDAVQASINAFGAGLTLFSTSTGYPVILGTNNTERMRIDSSGNVGIGTGSPGQKLDVNGGIRTQGWGSSATTGVILFGTAATAAQVYGNDTIMALYTNGSERMRIHASGGVSIGNTTDSGAASLNVNGSLNGGYVALADGSTAMGFGAKNVVRVTPTASATYTSTVPAAGAICVLSILTSGTTSRTITFGTGFKSTGTLATGTTSARYFNITFVSDGTNLIEMSRTVAIA